MVNEVTLDFSDIFESDEGMLTIRDVFTGFPSEVYIEGESAFAYEVIEEVTEPIQVSDDEELISVFNLEIAYTTYIYAQVANREPYEIGKSYCKSSSRPMFRALYRCRRITNDGEFNICHDTEKHECRCPCYCHCYCEPHTAPRYIIDPPSKVTVSFDSCTSVEITDDGLIYHE